MAIFIFKRLLKGVKNFSGIGRSGYPSDYSPIEIENDKDLLVVYDISKSKSFEEDLSKHIIKPKKRIQKLIKSLMSGYIFENDPNDPDEYTHSRPGADVSGWKIYSKDINHWDRLVYGVKKPREKIINGIKSLVVPILLIENYGHDSDQEIKDRIKGN